MSKNWRNIELLILKLQYFWFTWRKTKINNFIMKEKEILFGCHGFTCVSWTHLLLPVFLRCYSGKKNTTRMTKHREKWVLMRISVLPRQSIHKYACTGPHTDTHTLLCVLSCITIFCLFFLHQVVCCSAHTVLYVTTVPADSARASRPADELFMQLQHDFTKSAFGPKPLWSLWHRQQISHEL